jgi:hypothetical protein
MIELPERLGEAMGSTSIVRSELPVNGRALQVQPSRDEVRNQLARILASPLFKNSRHYPALLRYIVEETLENRNVHLKERSLGVDVFGRDPNYDTNLDPVVRTSACEVRKRIAQYYHEAGHESEIRIDLPHGSYVPDFRFPENSAGAIPAEPAPVDAQPAAWRIIASLRPFTRYRSALILVAVMAAGIAAASLRQSRSATDRFWFPVWGSSDSIMVCIGGLGSDLQGASVATPAATEIGPTVLDVMMGDRVAFADAVTMARLTGLFRENHKKYDIRKGLAFTLNDFRKGPVVLIGAFNNSWTIRLENQLRFNFERDPVTRNPYIRDRLNPSKVNWRGDDKLPYAKFTGDYAIVSRFVDPRTERVVVVVAGIAKDGTLAAGEFVTDARYLEALARRAPSGWEHKNLQVVIATEVINGNVGPPRIIDTYFW